VYKVEGCSSKKICLMINGLGFWCRKTCERTTDNFLLVGTDQSIYFLPLSSGEINFPLPAWGMNKTSALDYDHVSDTVVWSDAHLKHISAIYRNGTNTRILVENLGTVML
jgi:hypothetical protein